MKISRLVFGIFAFVFFQSTFAQSLVNNACVDKITKQPLTGAALSACSKLHPPTVAINPPINTPTRPYVINLAEVEPNDTVASAQVITVNPVLTGIKASLKSAYDADFYKVTVGAGENIDIGISYASKSRLMLSAHNKFGQLFALSERTIGSSQLIQIKNTSKSSNVFYFRVSYISGEAGNYSVSLFRN